MQTRTENRFVQRLEKFDAELDSAIYLVDELCKYSTVGNEDIKSMIETCGMSLLSLRQNLKRFLISNPEQSRGTHEPDPNYGR
jgi:hypothetical protein